MNIAEHLKGILSGEVSDAPEILMNYSHDASLFEVMPEVVVSPKDVSDVKNIVNFVREEKGKGTAISLTARAAGTCMSGGSLNTSVILDSMKHLNSIGEVEGDSIVVEPGAYYRDMEKKTLTHGLIMPAYTASKDLCAVGGMVANNAAGEKTLSYGATEKYVRKLSMVLSDGNEYEFGPLSVSELEAKKKLTTFEGEVYRNMHELIEMNYEKIKAARPNVSKNSSGYYLWDVWDKTTFDLTKLFVGSQGTLGIITKITFGLVPVQTHKRLLVLTLVDLKPLANIVATVLKYKPESFESYDDHTYDLAEKYMAECTECVITAPGVLLTLIAEFTGSSEQEALEKVQAAHVALQGIKVHASIITNEEEAESYWRIRRASFKLLRDHTEGSERVAPFIDDIIVLPEKLVEFLPRLNAILNQYKLVYTLAGHIGNGNFHLIPLVNMTDPKEREKIKEIAEKVFTLVFEFKGSMAGEHNDGIIRTPFLPKMFGPEICALFKQTKDIFDPSGIFNPGKKVGGSMEYSMGRLCASNICEHL
jgi:FAD/FMN-containing dehydrogenase